MRRFASTLVKYKQDDGILTFTFIPLFLKKRLSPFSKNVRKNEAQADKTKKKKKKNLIAFEKLPFSLFFYKVKQVALYD